MSSFYEDASLVMIPSGYKTSKVYCAKPTDGAGDLTFTRSNDTATRVASNGLIEKVRTNLLLQSNTFSTTWSTSSATITGGQAGYDGTNNAWLLGATANSGYIGQAISASVLHTESVYAKAGTLGWVLLLTSGGGNAYFNLTTGVVGSSSGILSAKIESVGGGWYRCSISQTSTTTTFRIYPAFADGNLNSSGGNILIQNAQLETGDIATDPILTTTAAVSVGPVANVPRLDYLNSSCPRLLLEPQRTNLALFSEQFDNAGWTKAGSTITANSATSPDGYTNADSIVETATTATHLVLQSVALTAATHTFSCFIKAVSGSTRNVGLLFNSTGRGVLVNPSNGAVVAYFGTTAASDVEIKTYPNGWYRVSVTATTAAITESMRIYLGNGTTWTSVYAGDGTSSALIWGAQLELGAYATSYIPTLGAAVTRGADACSKTGISSLIGQTEGTIFLQFDNRLLTSYPNEYPLQIVGSGGHQLWLRKESGSNTFTARLIVSSSTIWTFSAIPVPNGNTKIAISYKTGNSALYLNGTQFGSTSTAAFTGSAFADLYFNLSGTANPELILNQALLFKTRLSNSDLAALTTL